MRPMNSTAPAELSLIAQKNGRSTTMEKGGIASVGCMPTEVAAAAVVPSSSTAMTVLWATEPM